MDTKKIETVLTTVTIDSKVDSGKIDVVVGESAKMDVVKAVNYIQSGKAEIEKAVQQGKQELDTEGQIYVDLAKDWAIKTDGTVDGSEYSSKYYAEQILPIADEIVTVAGISSDVSAVGGIADDVSAVASNSTDISTVAGISSDVATVSGIASDVSAVSGISSDVTSVASNSSDISAVADDIASVVAVAGDLTNIDNASTYAAEAKQWAIGEPSEPTGYSAKYWAEQASQTLPNDGQLDIQVNGSSIATFTANQSGNTTADITIPSSLPDQTGNEGKFLTTDGTDASWEYSISDKGYYSYATQYYPGDLVKAYTQGSYHRYLCTSPSKGDSTPSGSKWLDLSGYITKFYQNSSDQPILSYTASGWSGDTMSGIWLSVPGNQTNYAKLPTINQFSGVLKVPSGIDGYSPDSAFGDVAFSNDYSDLDNLPNYGAGLSYSSSSLQLLDQNGNNLGSAVTINSTPDLDGVTIDTNSSDELEAIGTVNKNTAVGATAVKYDWIGTLAEYNAQNVETLHPEWVCYITDDVSGGTSVYTKAEVDSAISTALTTMLDSAFPVGSRYITEASTCPLATLIPNSTWVLTSQGRVLQGADSNHASGTTAGAGLPNITGSATYISSDGINQSDYPDSGAFSWGNYNYTQVTQTISGASKRDLHFNASDSNSIYGNSTTVQPPAEFVNIFKRTA